MKLDLTRYRQPVSHFARTFQPEEVGGHGSARKGEDEHDGKGPGDASAHRRGH